MELRIRTPGTEAIYGADSPDFLHPELLGTHPDRGNWPAVMGALGMSGDPTRRELVARLRELRDEESLDETVMRNTARCRWEDLSEFAVWSHPMLMLTVHLPETAGGGIRRCPAHVKADVDVRKVFVRNAQNDLPRADRGGRAVAALFESDRRRVAQAWRAAWDRAEDGTAAVGLELAQQKADREKEEIGAEIERQVEALRTRTGGRRGSSAGRRGGSGQSDDRDRIRGSGTRPESADEIRPRVLVDPEALTVVDPSGKVVGGSPPSGGARPRGGGGLVDPGGTRPRSPRNRMPLRGYSDQEREDVGFELARRVLSSDHEKIVDLRAQRGVGADATDELKRFYELKVSAGREPNDVTLTNAEWQRARGSSDFFLVVVSGVEKAEAKPSVRIIPRPLDQLEQRVSGMVVLSGVRDAKSVTYEFAPAGAELDGEEANRGAD